MCYLEAILSLFISLPQFSSADCANIAFPDYGAKFDVCPLRLQTGGQLDYYTVYDARYEFDENAKFKYYFNIFDPVISVPPGVCQADATKVKGPCTAVDANDVCTNHEAIGLQTVSAYQVKEDSVGADIECSHLTNIAGSDDLAFKLYNVMLMQTTGEARHYPTEGLIIKKQLGDYEPTICTDSSFSDYRFQWILLCSNTDDGTNIPAIKNVYYDPTKCLYFTRLKTIYGCPTECRRYQNKLCNGISSGVCSYDWSLGKPRCKCLNGYSGDDCSVFTAVSPPVRLINPITPSQYAQTVQNIVFEGEQMTISLQQVGFYAVHESHSDYVYYLNPYFPIDATKTGFPSSCADFTSVGYPCLNIDESTGECLEYNTEISAGNVFQHNRVTDECVLFSSELEINLYDDTRPAKGVAITAFNGAYCDPSNVNRDFVVNMLCSDVNHASGTPPATTTPYSTTIYANDAYGCSYVVWMESAIFCPWNCVLQNGLEYSVCSNHGECVFDFNVGFERCLCDDGWTGISCETLGGGGANSGWFTWLLNQNILLSIIAGLLVLLCVISLIFWKFYLRLHRKASKMIDNTGLIDAYDDGISVKTVYSDDKSNSHRSSESCSDDQEKRLFIQ